jgi:sarcosine oxidase
MGTSREYMTGRTGVSETLYEHIVVGKGLMGAAAARHLSAEGTHVALIGPDEPADRSTHQGVFASHYDEGRITRILDADRIWALLAQRSIDRYREIEARSGVPFYNEVGHLTVGPEPQTADDYTARVQAVGTQLGVTYETYAEVALKEQFPYLAFASGSVGMYQPHTSGHVSPRAQVLAQATVARQQGAAIISETVHTVRQGHNHVEVLTEEGHVYRAAHVLVAAGGFTNTKNLLPRPLKLDVYARTIVLMELGADDVQRLRSMPSVIYKSRNPDGGCYILPPIQYPNGKYYLKIGGGTPNDPKLHTLDELGVWFRSRGRQADAEHLTARLHAIVPNLNPVAVHSESCVTSYTPTPYLYAGKFDGGRIGVLTAGTGSAAKSADEIGRMGALMMRNQSWVYDLEAAHFRLQFADTPGNV